MVYFIVNPEAGKGKSLRAVPLIENYMNNTQISYRILKTDGPVSATTMARHYAQGDAELIVSVGGDGTLQEIAAGLIGTDIPVAIIPTGSGNDFASNIFKESRKMTFESKIIFYLERIIERKIIYIDSVNAKLFTRSGKIKEQTFLNIGHLGIDTLTVFYANSYKERYDKLSYLLGLLKAAVMYKPVRIKLVIDGKSVENKYMLAASSNGTTYGGGFKISPKAKIEDGLLNICTASIIPKALVFILFPFVIAGKHSIFSFVKFYEAKKISYLFDGTQIISLDGNIFEVHKRMDFEIAEKSIALVC